MSPDHAGQVGAVDDGLSVFLGVRRRLFGIAYRILGSAADADDVVQSVWLRWQTLDRAAVLDPPAFLATAATRLALNVARSARARREAYVGPWLPEPVDTRDDPRLGAERDEALQLAVLVLLEKLTARERAAYVLREAFGYTFEQIAQMLELEAANVRQLVSRARRHIADGRRAPVDAAAHGRLLDAFLAAARRGDAAQMEGLFAAEVVSTSDGGGVVRAARKPIIGRAVVARFVARATPGLWSGVSIQRRQVNGTPAAAIVRDGAVVGLVAIDASDRGIEHVLWLMRPSKLAALARPGSPTPPPAPPASPSDPAPVGV